jgi:TM2 domain-containing membrane protein YozV
MVLDTQLELAQRQKSVWLAYFFMWLTLGMGHQFYLGNARKGWWYLLGDLATLLLVGSGFGLACAQPSCPACAGWGLLLMGLGGLLWLGLVACRLVDLCTIPRRTADANARLEDRLLSELTRGHVTP